MGFLLVNARRGCACLGWCGRNHVPRWVYIVAIAVKGRHIGFGRRVSAHTIVDKHGIALVI